MQKLDPRVAHQPVSDQLLSDVAAALAIVESRPLRCAAFANDAGSHAVARLIIVVGDDDDAWELDLFAESPLALLVDGAAALLPDLRSMLDWKSVATPGGKHIYVRAERRRYRLEEQAAQLLGEEAPPRALL